VIGRGAFAVVKTYCKDLGADIAVKIFQTSSAGYETPQVVISFKSSAAMQTIRQPLR
jgi:hypothetical protein